MILRGGIELCWKSGCYLYYREEDVDRLLELDHPALVRGNHRVVRSVQRRGLPRAEGLLDGRLRLLLLPLRLYRLRAGAPPPAQQHKPKPGVAANEH